MKILYLDPVVRTSTSHNYKYYDGLYDELEDVQLYRGIPTNLDHLITSLDYQPDIVLFGLGWFNHKYFGQIANLNIPSVCHLFKPQNHLKEKLSFCKVNGISKIITPIPHYKEYEKITGIPTELFTYGFDPSTFFDREVEKKYDIGFSGALHENKHYPPGAFKRDNLRSLIGEKLKKLKNINIFWQASDDFPARIPSYEDYATLINSSKIWIATQAAFGDITPRFFEIMASRTLLFCQKIPETYKNILQDGVNCVQFKHDLSDFEDKLFYYLSHSEEREKIADRAYATVHNYHTWKKRTSALMDTCKEIL